MIKRFPDPFGETHLPNLTFFYVKLVLLYTMCLPHDQTPKYNTEGYSVFPTLKTSRSLWSILYFR